MKTSTKYIINHQIILGLLFLISAVTHAQLKNNFEPRFNEAVNGDFTMIANNMVSTTATGDYNGGDNNQDFNLVYVDIDGNTGIGLNTFNSSRAEFKNPSPGTSCLTIKKVFLYWAASDFEPDANQNSENQPAWDFDDIKLMLPGETDYTDYTADEVLYRGRDDNGDGNPNDHFSNDPYICVKDITTIVTDLVANGNEDSAYGQYQVANVEGKIGNLTEHASVFPTGVSGGWQIVFVYDSPLLPLKNVSIYDGYAHVTDIDNNYNILVDGFQTVPAPQDVNIRVLMGALEGDRNLSGDQLQIENVSNTFVPLSIAPLRDANNFFNSRITIDNNNFLDRTPQSQNTSGFDAAIFQLDNPSNSIIGNDQTSATFRLTANQETYGVFLLGLSVDVFEPNLGPIEVLTNIANTPVAPSTTITGNFTVENKGNDDAVNVTISSTLPPQLTLVEPIVGLDPTQITYTYNSGTGELVFTVIDGNADAGDPAFDVDFDLQIRDECYFLEQNCNLSFGLQFVAAYQGVQNPTMQTTDSSSALDVCGVGNNQETIINVIQPSISWQTAVGSLDANVECNDSSALTAAQNLTPVANKCALVPVKTSGAFVPDAGCSSTGTYTNTWNFTDACGVTISDFVQTITVINTTPIVLPPNGSNTVDCISDASETFTLPTVTDACGNTLTPSTAVITDSPDPLTCEGTRTYTYTYTDCAGNSADWAFVYTIDTPAFTIADADGAITVDCIADADGSGITL
ncbi:hypothetical protein DIS18_14800, partial [Algibacter marinivivus]